MTQPIALIVGASGIVGNAAARHMAGEGWDVHGLARKPPTDTAGVSPVAADLTDPASLRAALADLHPTHVVLSTWQRRPTEAENCAVNGAMVRNLLAALAHAPLEHVALVTGLKHYLGPFDAYGKGRMPPTPFREEQARLPVENFYYAQEDELFAAAGRQGFGWSVHRPHTIVGYAIGNAMNMGVTLAVHASLCKATGRPFLFPGSPTQWNGLTDMTDARQLARHVTWASTTPAARNKAFNVVNGDVFRWSWMWSRLAEWFGLRAAPYPGHATPLETQMADDAAIWRDLAVACSLAEPDINRLVSAWHTDADLGRPIEVVTDMSKSRMLGYLDYQPTDLAFHELFADLRAKHIIP